MKILVPFTVRDIGGPSSFVRKFQTEMERRGHAVTFDEGTEYDLVLVIVQAPFSTLFRARKLKKPIIQRLDGVYYWSVAKWRFPLLNLKAAIVRHFFTDYTVYQSEYSKRSAERFLGRTVRIPSTIIYNGVDTERFSPEGKTEALRDTPDQQVFFTASEFRRKDQILPILHALEYYHEHYSQSFKFVIAGSFNRELAGFDKELGRYPWAQFLGKISNEDLPSYERAADVFLFTHLNPPCPNNIIEAMSSGLPICGIRDGAMPELINEGNNGLLVPTNGEAYWQTRNYDPVTFANNLARIIENRERFSRESRQYAQQRFSLETMIDQYQAIFQDFV